MKRLVQHNVFYYDFTQRLNRYIVDRVIKSHQDTKLSYQRSLKYVEFYSFFQMWPTESGGFQKFESPPALSNKRTTVFVVRSLNLAVVYFNEFAYSCDINFDITDPPGLSDLKTKIYEKA